MLIKRILTAIFLLLALSGAVYYIPHYNLYLIMVTILLLVVNEATNIYKFSLLESILLILFNAISILMIHYLYHNLNLYYIENWHSLMLLFRVMTFILWLIIVPFILVKFLNLSKLQISFIISLIVMTTYNSYLYLFNIIGITQIFTIFSLAWVADSVAYFTGRLIGKHKISVRISPGKSWEGAIGACLVTIIYFLALQYFNLIKYIRSPYYGALFAIFIVIISIEGDFLESWCKRVAGVKDSGIILPGHGGIWDRVDSLLAVIAISFMVL